MGYISDRSGKVWLGSSAISNFWPSIVTGLIVYFSHLRVNICLSDALVQQLPHGAFESGADLLRFVGHVQVRYPKLFFRQSKKKGPKKVGRRRGGRGGVLSLCIAVVV